MTKTSFDARVDGDGTLRISLPLGIYLADQLFRITIEPISIASMSQEEWQRRVLEIAGKWQGEFVRPDQGTFEVRNPLIDGQSQPDSDT